MLDALHVARFSLRDLWDEFVLMVLLNLLWCMAAVLPIVPLLILSNVGLLWVLALSLLLALPLPVISGAFCFVANQVARGKVARWATFGEGVRRYWFKSLVVALINLIVVILIAANVQFYAVVLQGTWTNFALSAWAVVGLYWLLIQVFWFPMILEQENEKVFLALRNSMAMVIITPAFSLTLALILALFTVLSVALSVPAIVALAAFVLLMSNHATRSRLAYVKKKSYRPGEEQD
jgi:hypothetical protein